VQIIEPGSHFVRLDLALLLDFCVPNFERRKKDRDELLLATPIVKLIRLEQQRRKSGHHMRGKAREYYEKHAPFIPVLTLDLDNYLDCNDESVSSSLQADKKSKGKKKPYRFLDPDRHKLIHQSVIDGCTLKETRRGHGQSKDPTALAR
jgi:hypothetical protein